MSRPPAEDTPAPLNRLLAALPARELRRLLPRLEAVHPELKTVLQRPGEPIRHLYFPTRGVVSLLMPLEDGGKIEVGLVGREGLVGLPIFLGVETSPVLSMVQVPGELLRIPSAVFRACIGRRTVLHRLLLRYTHALLAQLSHGAACGSRHPLSKRLCRWLLLLQSRAEADRFPMTHELMAIMLGVRRASVTEAAHELREAGLIRYGRGQLTVLDRDGLEAAACSCYRAIQNHLDFL
jgi:CRP-like cAMP-binding protein